MAEAKTALVTGANRGMGFEVSRQLARQGLRVILTSRDRERGEAAAALLRGEGLDVLVRALDVADPYSVQEIARYVLREFGRLDVLVNNAAIIEPDGESILELDPEILWGTLATNLGGPLMLCSAFVPSMCRSGYGRVVNVTSEYGSIRDLGMSVPAYSLSKVALNALTRMAAHACRRWPNVKVNAVDPGWVRTDMGGSSATRSVEQGADTIVWLATLPDDGPSDSLFFDRQQVAW